MKSWDEFMTAQPDLAEMMRPFFELFLDCAMYTHLVDRDNQGERPQHNSWRS